mgnify:CR=1 FL=1
MVLIKKPKGGIGKSELSGPVRVIKLFRNAVKTADSKIWNLNRVVVFKGNPMLCTV